MKTWKVIMIIKLLALPYSQWRPLPIWSSSQEEEKRDFYKACHRSLYSIFCHLDENILFSIDMFTSIFKFYACRFVLENN